MTFRNLTAAGLLGALLLPAAADAATKSVFRGPPPKGELKGVKGPAFDSSFYPNRVTIAAGDKIKLTTLGFGDTIFVPKGQKAPAFAVPNPDAPVSGAKDAAGNDMWFNGRPAFAPNPAAIMPQGGTSIDGSKVVGSGLALDGPPKPWVVTFPKAGRYVLRSALQPGVTLTVNVVKNKKAPKKQPAAGTSQKPTGGSGVAESAPNPDARRIARQLRANTKLANRLLKYKGPKGNVVRAGNDAKGVATIAFFPAKKTVKVGETVKFTMSTHSIETHNVAFGPKAYLDEHAERFFGPVFEPFVTFRSEAPGSPISFDGANHGNGYVNTGVLDANPVTAFPKSERITFTKAGTYAYYCAVHGNDMAGEIVVK
jgi:plastocyanin